MQRRSRNNLDDIFTSIAKGSYDELKHYLQHGGISNLRDGRGSTLLHKAVEDNHIDKVKLLLQHDANINVVDQNGCMPVYIAITNENNVILEILLESGAALNVVAYQQTTPLIHAVVSENIPAVRLIIRKGKDCDVNMENYIKQTALTEAIICKNRPICDLLLRHGASVKAIYKRGRITQQAARYMCSDMALMELFLSHDEPIDLHYHLIVCCVLRKFDIAELLLSKFEDPFQLKALGFIMRQEEQPIWERLVKSSVRRYSLATKCSKENRLLTMLLGFCSAELRDKQWKVQRQRAVTLLRVLVSYGLVIHPQTSVKPCSWDCSCRKAIFTALYGMDSVTPLKSQCCSVIRQYAINRSGQFDEDRVKALPIPISLIKFVCMDDW